MKRFRVLPCLTITLLALSIVPAAAAQITIDQAVTESHDAAWNRTTRVQHKRIEANGRTIETQVVETPSINGGYALESATEKETIEDGSDTIREVERWYAPDAEGHSRLYRIVETRKTATPGKSTATIRVRYDTDVNGHPQEMEREVQESVSLNKATTQTTSTLSLPRGGLFFPVQRTVTVEKAKEGGLTDVRRTVSFADQNGKFVDAQVTDIVEEQSRDRSTRRTEKRVAQGDTGKILGEGQISPIQRTETQEWKDSNGQEHSMADTYSMFTAGVASDGQLHMDRQVATVRTAMSDGSTRTVQETAQINPGVRTDRPQRKTRRTEISKQDSGKHFETQTTIEAPNSSGAMQPYCISNTRGFGEREAVTATSADPAEDNSCH